MERRELPETSEAIGFSDLVRFFRRGLVLALAIGSASAVAAFMLTRSMTPVYEATSTVLMARSTSDIQSFGSSLVTAPTLDPSAYRAVALSESRLQRALQATESDRASRRDVEELRDSITVRFDDDRNSALIHVSVRTNVPEGAAELANEIAVGLVAWDKERATDNLQQIVASLESQIAALDAHSGELPGANGDDATAATSRRELRARQQEQLEYARTLVNSAVGLLSVLEPALPPLDPVAPKPALNAALAFVLGTFAVYGLLLGRDALGTKLRDSEDIARASGLPVLAEFPRVPTGTRRLPREGSSFLRTNLMFATTDAHPKVILVTSTQQGEGKSSVSLSLAESFARNGHTTLLVDADLRKPTLASEYGLLHDSAAPLQAWLEHPHETHAPARIELSTSVSFDIVPSYRPAPSPTELLGRGFLEVLERWRQEYDVIIVDSAPVLPVADTLTIAPLCTGTLLVASATETDRRRLTSATKLLERIGVRVIGIVATRLSRDSRSPQVYGYGYGASGEEVDALSRSPRSSQDASRRSTTV